MGHTPLPPFAATSGPRSAKMVLIGEAWGQSESELKKPFVGESGKELFSMLGEAMPDVAPELHAQICSSFRYGLAWSKRRDEWLAAAGILMTNVLALRPPGNKVEELCSSKLEVGKDYDLPALAKGKYLLPEYLPELSRLFAEISAIRPNLVVALGNTACWALLLTAGISSIRGYVSLSTPLSEALEYRVKVLPTYHPAGVLRQWAWRPIVVADLMKASREREFPEIRRPQRQVLHSPSLGEIQQWTARFKQVNPPVLSCDIETAMGQITCISFAYRVDEALCIPLLDEGRGGNYWASLREELAVWELIEELLKHPCKKLFQNGMYDLQYITRLGILPRNLTEDTMLLHHAIFPEMQKGLGFLGSIYTSEASWKLMNRKKRDTEKRDE